MIRWTEEELRSMQEFDERIDAGCRKARKKKEEPDDGLTANQRRYRNNRQEYIERAAKWAKENPERVKASRHKRYMKDPEAVKAHNREYYWAHRDEILAKRKEKRRKKRECQEGKAAPADGSEVRGVSQAV